MMNRDAAHDKTSQVVDVTLGLIGDKQHIKCVKDFKKKLLEEFEIEIKPWTLKKILKEELELRYKRIAGTSWQGNSNKNLILRQQFALEFLSIDLTKKTIINVDESWIGMTDFNRMKWSEPGRPNSVPKKMLQPRISMIAGLDSNG